MAISSTQYVDLLFKKLSGVAKTDNSTNKSASNESISSPPLLRGDIIWAKSNLIPSTAQAVAGITQAYLTTSAIECTADDTSIPISSVVPTWKTGQTDWIPPEFGSTWSAKVFIDDAGAADPTSTGTEIFAAGAGGTGEYFFDYQSGIVNLIGESLPSGLTSSKKLYVTGYRYIGQKGLSGDSATGEFGNIVIAQNTISVGNTDGNLVLAPNGDGYVTINGDTGFIPPVGNSAERPGTPPAGLTRYNTTTNYLEFYNGAGWVAAGPEAGTITAQTLVGDGSTDTFTLEKISTAESIIVSTNGTVQKPNTAYTVSGTGITFAEPPADGDTVDVRFITLTYSFNSITLPVYTRAETLALVGMQQADTVYVTDGDNGDPCIAVYNGTAWKIIKFDSDLL